MKVLASYNIKGGVGKTTISALLARIFSEEDGGKVHTARGVKRIIIENRTAVGVELEEHRIGDHRLGGHQLDAVALQGAHGGGRIAVAGLILFAAVTFTILVVGYGTGFWSLPA